MTIDFNYKIYNSSPISHWMMGVFNNHGTGRELSLSKDVKLSEREVERVNRKTYNYKSRSYVSKLIIEEINKKLPPSCLMTLMYVLVVGNQQNWRNNKAVFLVDDYLNVENSETLIGLFQIMEYILDHNGFSVHGSSISGACITDLGRAYLYCLQKWELNYYEIYDN